MCPVGTELKMEPGREGVSLLGEGGGGGGQRTFGPLSLINFSIIRGWVGARVLP